MIPTGPALQALPFLQHPPAPGNTSSSCSSTTPRLQLPSPRQVLRPLPSQGPVAVAVLVTLHRGPAVCTSRSGPPLQSRLLTAWGPMGACPGILARVWLGQCRRRQLLQQLAPPGLIRA